MAKSSSHLQLNIQTTRSSRLEVYRRKVVVENFAKFTGICEQSSSFWKFCVSRTATLSRKGSFAGIFLWILKFFLGWLIEGFFLFPLKCCLFPFSILYRKNNLWGQKCDEIIYRSGENQFQSKLCQPQSIAKAWTILFHYSILTLFLTCSSFLSSFSITVFMKFFLYQNESLVLI